MHLLKPNDYKIAEPLLRKFKHHTVIKTILAGKTKGHVYINDPNQLSYAFAQFKHQTFISGKPDSVEKSQLRSFFISEVYKNCRNADVPLFHLNVDSPGWIVLLKDCLESLNPIIVDYQCYEYTITEFKHGIQAPEKYLIQHVDKALLQIDFQGKNELLSEMCSERESIDAFLEKSFGVVAFHNENLAGWCLSEYNHKNFCEIGIATLPPYQKQGLARAMTNTFLNLALANSINKVLWHCYKSNQPSWRTALSVGFILLKEEPVFMVYLDPSINSAVHGNLNFENRHYDKALFWYEKALANISPRSWMAWKAACAAAHLGQINPAFMYLNQAIELGFHDLDQLVQSEPMKFLKSDSRWGEIIARLNESLPS